MKRTIFVLATMLVVVATLFAVLVLRPVRTVKAHNHCSARTLKGNYGFTAFGGYGTTSPFSPASAVGIVTFDGEGNLSGADIYTTVGGTVVQSNQTFSGATYSVSSTCAFSATDVSLFGATVTFNGSVLDAEAGSEVVTDVESNLTNVTGTADLKKVQGWD